MDDGKILYYVLFAGEDYYPSPSMYDYHGSANTLADIKRMAEEMKEAQTYGALNTFCNLDWQQIASVTRTEVRLILIREFGHGDEGFGWQQWEENPEISDENLL